MSHTQDSARAAIGSPTENINESLLAFYQANGATSNDLNDAEREFLRSRGNKLDRLNDMWHVYLRALSYVGSVNDMLKGFWEGTDYISPPFLTFKPSIYDGNKTATNVVTGQVEKLATGTVRVSVENLDATTSIIVGFGVTAKDAEDNIGTGTTIPALTTTILSPTIPDKYIAWKGATATVTARMIQGV